MKHAIVTSLAVVASIAATSGIWYANWPSPPAKPVAPVIVGNIRDTISALLPAAFDEAQKYPSIANSDSDVIIQHNSRVNVCVYADDTVKVTVATDVGQNISGQGLSLREAENDLGQKTAAISKLMN